jgi:hypothetical protein
MLVASLSFYRLAASDNAPQLCRVILYPGAFALLALQALLLVRDLQGTLVLWDFVAFYFDSHVARYGESTALRSQRRARRPPCCRPSGSRRNTSYRASSRDAGWSIAFPVPNAFRSQSARLGPVSSQCRFWGLRPLVLSSERFRLCGASVNMFVLCSITEPLNKEPPCPFVVAARAAPRTCFRRTA